MERERTFEAQLLQNLDRSTNVVNAFLGTRGVDVTGVTRLDTASYKTIEFWPLAQSRSLTRQVLMRESPTNIILIYNLTIIVEISEILCRDQRGG